MHDRRSFLRLGVAAAAAAALDDVLRAQPTPPAAGPPRLLLVHGRAQQGKKADELEAAWLESLKRGAAKSGVTLPDGHRGVNLASTAKVDDDRVSATFALPARTALVVRYSG